MQLRDVKNNISFPGQWGFFGGSVNYGEMPYEAAERELFEEIGYKPQTIHKLNTHKIHELGNIISHAYCCPLTAPIECIKLREGIDLGLFSLEEIMSGKLYSSKMRRKFPVIGIPHVTNTIKALFKFIKES
jgi:8-oxo-dGTP diphosphatase